MLKTIYCVTEWVQLVLQHCWQNQLNSDDARFVPHELEGMSQSCLTKFLINESEPEVNFLHSSAGILNKFYANHLYKNKDTLQNKFGCVKEYSKWEKCSLGLTLVAQKRQCVNFLKTLWTWKITCEWENHSFLSCKCISQVLYQTISNVKNNKSELWKTV